MLCHDGDYVVVLTVSQKHNLRNRTKRPGHQSSLLSINLTLLGQVLQSLMARNTRYWWALYRNIESGYGYWYCIKTSNQNMYFLILFRIQKGKPIHGNSSETALNRPKNCPSNQIDFPIAEINCLLHWHLYNICNHLYSFITLYLRTQLCLKLSKISAVSGISAFWSKLI